MTTLFLLDLTLIAYLGTNADFILTFFLGALAYKIYKTKNHKLYVVLLAVYISGIVNPIIPQILGLTYHFYLSHQIKKRNDNEFLYLENATFSTNFAVLSITKLFQIFGKDLYSTAIPKLLSDKNLNHSLMSMLVLTIGTLILSILSFEILAWKDKNLNSENSVNSITIYTLVQTLILLVMHTFAFRGESMSALSCTTFIMQFAGTGFFYILMLHNMQLKFAK